MASILVLVEHEEGTPKKVTYEMLAKARELGEPVALFVGEGLAVPTEALGRHGAARILAATGEQGRGLAARRPPRLGRARRRRGRRRGPGVHPERVRRRDGRALEGQDRH